MCLRRSIKALQFLLLAIFATAEYSTNLDSATVQQTSGNGVYDGSAVYGNGWRDKSRDKPRPEPYPVVEGVFYNVIGGVELMAKHRNDSQTELPVADIQVCGEACFDTADCKAWSYDASGKCRILTQTELKVKKNRLYRSALLESRFKSDHDQKIMAKLAEAMSAYEVRANSTKLLILHPTVPKYAPAEKPTTNETELGEPLTQIITILYFALLGSAMMLITLTVWIWSFPPISFFSRRKPVQSPPRKTINP